MSGLTVLLYIVLLLLSLIVFAVLYLIFLNLHQKRIFRSQGVPHCPIKLSVMLNLIRGKLHILEVEKIIYENALKIGAPLVGISDPTGPIYYVTDLELMKSIYVKDFDHFMNRRAFSRVEGDMLNKMLISMEGDKWKAMRSKLTPIFTTSKIRRVFDIFDACSLRMCEFLEEHIGSEGEDLDVAKIHAKFATDVIANCVFGIDSQCFERDLDSQSEFEKMGSNFQCRFSFTALFKFIIVHVCPLMGRWVNLQPFDSEPQKYFAKIIKDEMKLRRDTGEKKEDFLQLLMDTQKEEDSKETLEDLDDDTIIANCELFLLAGFDTTKSVMVCSTYLLAVNPEVQERLFEEIHEVLERDGGKLSYDVISKMTYLDCFLNESLRYYPANTRTERLCTIDYTVPGTDWVIPKGRIVILPLYALHHDEKYYENADKFDPERFQGDKKKDRHPFSYSPFGQGPRNCIGMRFGVFEVKAMIFRLIQHFKLEACSRTDIPPRFSTNPNLSPKNGMWLKIIPR